MNKTPKAGFARLRAVAAVVGIALALLAAATPGLASNPNINYQRGHLFYLAYENSPSGPEYLVDLGDESVFTNATTNVTLPDVRAGDFASIFSGITPNLWVGLFGIQNPVTLDGILSANGPKDDTQFNSSSVVGAVQQIDTWGTGLAAFSSPVGSSANAGQFPGAVNGSYQATLNGSSQGSLGNNVQWNVETRLSSSAGTRIGPTKIHFDSAVNNPTSGANSRAVVGMFTLFTDGTVLYQPDRDGDFLPDVPIGSDPNADKCPGVNSTNNTDADADSRAVPCDCNDADATVWSAPGEATGIAFSSHTALAWSAPADKGGTAALTYDVLRGTQTVGGTAPTYSCFLTGTASASSTDSDVPTLGGSPFFYLIRAINPCPGTLGDGPVGTGRINPTSMSR